MALLAPYMLKTVVAPSKLLLAHPKSTSLSLSIGALMWIFVGFFASLMTFVSLQGAFIGITLKDPHFMDPLMARLRCRPTKSFIPVRGHRYGA